MWNCGAFNKLQNGKSEGRGGLINSHATVSSKRRAGKTLALVRKEARAPSRRESCPNISHQPEEVPSGLYLPRKAA